MANSLSICPACSHPTLVGTPAAGACSSCGAIAVAGNAVPLAVLLVAALAVRALLLRGRWTRRAASTVGVSTRHHAVA